MRLTTRIIKAPRKTNLTEDAGSLPSKVHSGFVCHGRCGRVLAQVGHAKLAEHALRRKSADITSLAAGYATSGFASVEVRVAELGGATWRKKRAKAPCLQVFFLCFCYVYFVTSKSILGCVTS